MELTQVRAFLTVAEELHFGRAAARLHISQPPLSRQIKELERELGVELFIRTSRSVKLTLAGEAFRRESLGIFRKAEAAISAARRASTEGTGSLVLGFVGAATYTTLPRLTAALGRDLPKINVRYVEATSTAQLDALMLERLDVGLLRPAAGLEGLASHIMAREKLSVAIPIGHRLAGRRRIDLEALEGEPFIGFAVEAPYLRGLLSDSFQRAGVRPDTRQELAQSQAILSLVSAGAGLALVPESTRNACFDNVVFRPYLVRGAPDNVTADLLAVWKRHPDNQIMPRVIDVIRSISS